MIASAGIVNLIVCPAQTVRTPCLRIPTQRGTLLLTVFGLLAVGIAVMVAEADGSLGLIPAIVIVVLVVVACLFFSLTVSVSGEAISIRFGVGLIRKSFRIRDVRDVRAVRNRWYYGWGIRYTPHGWLYNVSGLDAVELELKNGRTYRVGTDEPGELLAAIRAAAERPTWSIGTRVEKEL